MISKETTRRHFRRLGFLPNIKTAAVKIKFPIFTKITNLNNIYLHRSVSCSFSIYAIVLFNIFKDGTRLGYMMSRSRFILWGDRPEINTLERGNLLPVKCLKNHSAFWRSRKCEHFTNTGFP